MRREAVQLRTIGFEPVLGGRGVRAMGQDEAPEFWAMIHVLAMGHFMGRDIIQDMAGGENQTPIVGKIAGGRTGAPAAFLVTD